MKTTVHRSFTRSLVFAALSLALHCSASAQSSDALKLSIPPPLTGVQLGARLGYSVAIDGPHTVAGAYFDNTGGANSGAVKIFNTTTGALLFTLKNPVPSPYANFGRAVAVSGSRVVVGAPSAYAGALDAGSAYVFDLNSPTPTLPVAILTYPSPAADDNFGSSVAISGLNVAVGVPNDDAGGTLAGTVYVYSLSSATPAVPVATLNNPSPTAYGRFGTSVAIAGSRLVVGAPGNDAGEGKAYLYDVAGPTPSVPVAMLNNPSPVPAPSYRDAFGTSVAIAASRLVVGAPFEDAGAADSGSAYVFDAATGALLLTLNNPAPGSFDQFGGSVGIGAGKAVVGTAFDDNGGAGNSGSAYVFDSSSGALLHTLNNPTPANEDYFGFSVGIAGSHVVAGAYHDSTAAPAAGSAYVYDLNGGTPTVPAATLTDPGPAASDYFGNVVAVVGSTVAVGAPDDDSTGENSGTVSVYSLVSATPTVPVLTLNNPNPSVDDHFGNAIAASGTRLVVGAYLDDIGAPDAGRAYVYNLASGTPAVPTLTLNNPSPEAGDNFGFSVAISGTRVVVGEPYDNTGATHAGSVHVYDTTSATPSIPVVTLHNPSPAADDNFGIAVAVSGTRVVVGATGDDTSTGNAGIAYVFDLASGTPTVPVTTLNNPNPATNDYFGRSAAISGSRVVVGAANDDTGASDAGSAYVYDISSATPAVPVATLNNPNPAYGDNFGYSVAVSGAGVVVGALNDAPFGVGNAGTAYVYDVSRATPTVPTLTLNKINGAASDQLGTSVAIDGLTVAVGAPREDTAVVDKGYAYVFGAPTTTTGTPTLTAPASSSVWGPTVPVNFSLPEAALPGTVKLVFRNGAASFVITLAASQETSGAHGFSFSPASPTASAQIAAGDAIPEGTYNVALSYQDAVGSAAATSNVATGVDINTAVPQIAPPAGGFTPLAIIAGTPLDDYRPQAVVFNGSGLVSFTQVPAPGSATAVGAINVTLTVMGATGPANGTAFVVNAVSGANDTDNDGMNDAAEVKLALLGFNWQVAQPALVNSLLASANEAGLYTTSQIQALNLGIPLIARNPTTGIFKLTIGVEKSTDLQNFTPFPMTAPQTSINGNGELDFYFTEPGNAAFYRLQWK